MDMASAEAQRPRERKTRSLKCWAQVWPHQPRGFICAALACFFCGLSQASHQWLFCNTADIPGIQRVSIGIWQACFLELLSNGKYAEARCQRFDVSEKSMPVQILLAQLLVSFALLMQGVAMVFFGCTWGIAARRKHKSIIAPSLNRTAVILSVLSGIVTLIPAAYTASLVCGNGGLAFPKRYQIPRFPGEWHLGDGTYLGLVSVALQVLGGELLLWYQWRRSTKRRSGTREHLHPQPFRWVSSGSDDRVMDSSWTVGSTVYLPPSPPHVSMLPQPQLSFPSSSSSPTYNTPPFSPWTPPVRSTSLILSSLTPRECLAPLRPWSLPNLPTVPPFSSTLPDIQTSPLGNAPSLLHNLSFPSSSPYASPFSSPSGSSSHTEDLSLSYSLPTGRSPIPSPALPPSLSTPLPPQSPPGLTPIDI